MREHKIGFDAF